MVKGILSASCQVHALEYLKRSCGNFPQILVFKMPSYLVEAVLNISAWHLYC